MELTELYKLRRSFTIIGLTGRTGSGCSKIAELLSGDFETLKNGIREISELNNPIGIKKIEFALITYLTQIIGNHLKLLNIKTSYFFI